MKKRTRLILLTLSVLLLAAGIAAAAWFTKVYPADEQAQGLLQETNITLEEDGLLAVSPEQPSDTALIFYPGGRVEFSAYLPLLTRIAESNEIICFLPRMPLNMAILDVNRADEVMAAHPEIQTWYLGGHSLGGAMASRYAADHPDRIEGLILFGAYIYGDWPAEDTLTVYGSLETGVEAKIDYSENVVKIDGGNHAQFGNYGRQSGDPDAVISREEQQAAAAKAVSDFLAGREG